MDTWDRLREGASLALLRLPTPLPGLGGAAEVAGLLARALELVSSPRLGESDAGVLPPPASCLHTWLRACRPLLPACTPGSELAAPCFLLACLAPSLPGTPPLQPVSSHAPPLQALPCKQRNATQRPCNL